MTARTATVSRTMISTARRRGLLRLALLAILIFIGIAYVAPAYNFYTRNGEISRERDINKELTERNQQLALEKQKLLDGSQVEAVAREDLGLVKPGEQPYIVKDIEEQEAVTVAEPAAVSESVDPPPAEGGLLPVFFSGG